jgi:hypothetical protein
MGKNDVPDHASAKRRRLDQLTDLAKILLIGSEVLLLIGLGAFAILVLLMFIL